LDKRESAKKREVLDCEIDVDFKWVYEKYMFDSFKIEFNFI